MESFKDFGLKLDILVVLKSTQRFVSTRTQCYSLTVARGLSYFRVSNISSKATVFIVTKFRREPRGIRKTNSCSNGLGHMIILAAMLMSGSKSR